MADLLDAILKLSLFENQLIFRQIFNKNLSPKKCHLLKINSTFSCFSPLVYISPMKAISYITNAFVTEPVLRVMVKSNNLILLCSAYVKHYRVSNKHILSYKE